MPAGRPLQLIRCGDDSDNYAFTLNEEHLDEVRRPPLPFPSFRGSGVTHCV